MKMKYFQLLILLTTILSSGCSVNDTKPISETKIDTIELEQLANIAYDNESWEEVIRYYRMLTNKIPNDEKLWYRLGNAYAQINNTKSAIDAYKIDDENIGLLEHKGNIYRLLNLLCIIPMYAEHKRPNNYIYTKACTFLPEKNRQVVKQ